MSHELYYTSAPRGLRPGSNGYCTVTATHGMPAPLWQKLETLSDYRPLAEEPDTGTAKQPIALSHLRLSILGKTWSVLSRSCMAGVDHSRRRIFFTHHVALETTELPPGGPAWLAGQRGFLEMRWDGQVRELPTDRPAVMGNSPTEVCRAWKQAVGDAGWAGVLAEEFEKNPNRLVYLLYPLGVDPLPLLLEALALLPPEKRWQVTFSTLYRSLPQDVACVWRCLPLEAPEARKAKSVPGALVLDLSARLGQADGGPLVAAARSGKAPWGTSGRGGGQAMPVSGPWKPPVRTSSAVEEEVAEEPEPEPEPRLTRISEPMVQAPAPRGSSLVPFALGLLLGVVLLGGGAFGAWRVLENANAKNLEEALNKAKEEQKKAIEDTKAQGKTEKNLALETEKAAAEKDKNLALAKTRQDLNVAKMKEIAAALKGKLSKADLDKAIADAKAAKDKEKDKAVGPRNQALKVLIAGLFDEKKAEAGSKIKSYLEAIVNDKTVPKTDLMKLLEDWEGNERRSARSTTTLTDLIAIKTHLDYCEDLIENLGKKQAAKHDIYGKRYKDAKLRLKNLVEKNTSVLVRRDLELVAKRMAKLPPPE